MLCTAPRGRGEREQHHRPGGDVFGHALAADEPGAHEVAGVASVDGGAGRTDRLSARPAGLQDDTVGELLGRQAHALGAPVALDDDTLQPDRLGAPAAGLALGAEGVELAPVHVALERPHPGLVLWVTVFDGHGPDPPMGFVTPDLGTSSQLRAHVSTDRDRRPRTPDPGHRGVAPAPSGPDGRPAPCDREPSRGAACGACHRRSATCYDPLYPIELTAPSTWILNLHEGSSHSQSPVAATRGDSPRPPEPWKPPARC